MASAKETMIGIIGLQPDDSSYEEILRELAHGRMVQRGLSDSDAGRTVSDEDVKIRSRYRSRSSRDSYGPYRIPYLVRSKDRVEILGVFHSAMDIQRYLD
ncbi:MAG: plasmid stabilization system protein ParE [Pirellulaceae bacterium]|jgi:plasmid stabilization system protein ParE